MVSVLAVLIIVLLALFAVQVGTNTLVLTGMRFPSARFQAAAAFLARGSRARKPRWWSRTLCAERSFST
jgi:hypothetical protein